MKTFLLASVPFLAIAVMTAAVLAFDAALDAMKLPTISQAIWKLRDEHGVIVPIAINAFWFTYVGVTTAVLEIHFFGGPN